MFASGRLSPSLCERFGLAHRSWNGASSGRARPALDVGWGVSRPYGVTVLKPCVALCGSAVYRVYTGKAASSDRTEHPPVVGTKRAGHLANWLAGHSSYDIRGARQFFVELFVINRLPRYVQHTVRANGHAGLNQAPHLSRSERTRLIKPSRDDEERGCEFVPPQCWQRIFYVGCVTVVECNVNPRVLADDFQEFLKLRNPDPVELLVRLKLAPRGADTVEAQVKDLAALLSWFACYHALLGRLSMRLDIADNGVYNM
jgi:hypothetical protein